VGDGARALLAEAAGEGAREGEAMVNTGALEAVLESEENQRAKRELAGVAVSEARPSEEAEGDTAADLSSRAARGSVGAEGARTASGSATIAIKSGENGSFTSPEAPSVKRHTRRALQKREPATNDEGVGAGVDVELIVTGLTGGAEAGGVRPGGGVTGSVTHAFIDSVSSTSHARTHTHTHR
jgi:hypothetical protein